MACRGTRCMEQASPPACKAALMAFGGGEYTANRIEAGEWLRTMERGAAWAEPGDPSAGVVALPIARDGMDDVEARRLDSLVEAGFATGGEDGWTLSARGLDVVMGKARWLPA